MKKPTPAIAGAAPAETVSSDSSERRQFGGAVRWVYWVFAAVGAYYLITEHRAHLIDYLPFVLLMACPLMHLFHGHGGHGGHQPSKGDPS